MPFIAQARVECARLASWLSQCEVDSEIQVNNTKWTELNRSHTLIRFHFFFSFVLCFLQTVGNAISECCRVVTAYTYSWLFGCVLKINCNQYWWQCGDASRSLTHRRSCWDYFTSSLSHCWYWFAFVLFHRLDLRICWLRLTEWVWLCWRRYAITSIHFVHYWQ